MGHYFSFSGRSGRVEFLLVIILVQFLPGVLFLFLNKIIEISDILNIPTLLLGIIVPLGVVYILCAACVRRLHDFNSSGWWMLLWLLVLLPLPEEIHSLIGMCYAGGSAMLLFYPGDKQPNRFGPPPDILGGIISESKKEYTVGKNEEENRIDFKL